MEIMSTVSSAIRTYLSDAALVADARGGNHFAFEELCRRHSTKLTSCIRRILGDRADAEDVLQETLLRAFTHLHRFEGRSSVSTWLTRIAINAAFSTLRGKRRTMVPIYDAGEDPQTREVWVVRDRDPDPECQLIRKQQEILFAKWVRQLPPQLGMVVELRAKGEYSTKEIAGQLGISESAVKSRLWRAQHLLLDNSRTRKHGFRRVTARSFEIAPSVGGGMCAR
jgi:RNA polymerase sigma factor (sigma-70 family)